MPRPDPISSAQLPMMRRFWRIFRMLGLFAIMIAGIAVLLVARGDDGVHIHMLIATALGSGLTVMVGAAMVTLAFLSASTGHDDEAGRASDSRTDQE